MTTDHVYVKNDGSGLDKALHVTDSFIKKQHLTKRDSMHVRLLAEEMLGMVRAITGEFKALFWIEGNNEQCHLRLTADVEMDPDKRRELMSASTSGKNTSARGIMGKIRELVEIGMENYEDVSRLQMQYGVDPISYGMMGIDNEMMSQAMLTWSLNQYRESVLDSKDENEAYEEAWDELEKSIVANIADDVQVGIMKDRLEMTIFKRFAV
ncbi:MAG: hypothetical protein IJT96_10930 [Lachnospiraceae bacterium]|nr:hypothetical protein [Lachnospiraceae bacterium]